MKLREQINERWSMIVPDNVADWDAPSAWERCRFASMEANLKRGDILYDVGSEHGWISALYAREFVGGENMVLFEPSPEFWPNIRMTWEQNGLALPLGMAQVFVGAEATEGELRWATNEERIAVFGSQDWPSAAYGPECDAMAYKALHNGPSEIPTITLDDFSLAHRSVPDAITIDIEGAELLALQGCDRLLRYSRPLVWVSIHPDLMERDYHTLPSEIVSYMRDRGYRAKLLGVDHEEHFLFWPTERDDVNIDTKWVAS